MLTKMHKNSYLEFISFRSVLCNLYFILFYFLNLCHLGNSYWSHNSSINKGLSVGILNFYYLSIFYGIDEM